ncbi:hypothetical protein [Campylobacter fetus]|nr:hypothetical protein [Campylobacter fetus]
MSKFKKVLKVTMKQDKKYNKLLKKFYSLKSEFVRLDYFCRASKR